MSKKNTSQSLINQRIAAIRVWLEDEAPYVAFDQRHLDAGTPEQAYWHLGYLAALVDVLEAVTEGAGSKPGTANHSHSADPDA